MEYDKLELQILELLNQLPDAIVEKNFYKVTDSNGKEYLSIKLKLRDILYFYFKNDTFVLLHQFRKKTQKTPKREIERAKAEREDVYKRQGLN